MRHWIVFLLHLVQRVNLSQAAKATLQVIYHRSGSKSLRPVSTNSRSKIYIMVNYRFLICRIGEVGLLKLVSLAILILSKGN